MKTFSALLASISAFCLLLAPFPASGASSFESFEQYARSGHSIEVFPEGEATHRARLSLINSARFSLYLATYAFYWDEAGQEIAAALCKKSRAGLDVRILADGYGSKQLRSRQDWLLACGIHVVFDSVSHYSFEEILRTVHEKLLIADGEKLIIGGSGYGNHYRYAHRLSDQWHDLDSQMNGPAACAFQRVFGGAWKRLIENAIRARTNAMGFGPSEEWIAKRYGSRNIPRCEPKKFGDARVLHSYNDPSSASRPNLDLVIEAMTASKKEILVYAPYFVPHKRLSRALIRAAKRGLRVVVLTNSPESNSMTYLNIATHQDSRKLIKAGVEVRIWGRKNTMHRKGGVFDTRYAYLGSDNLDLRGQHHSSESVAYTDDLETTRMLKEEFEKDLKYSTPLTRKSIDEYLTRHSKAKNWLARILRGFL